MEEEKAGVADTSTAADQKSGQVSTEKNSASVSDSNHSEVAKTQDKETDISKEGKENKDKKPSTSEEKSEKQEPFYKHPAFQRMSRKNAKLSTEVGAIKTQNAELVGLVKELMALTKGEEFKPEKVENTEMPDSQELLDIEMDQFTKKTDLSDTEETEIIDIAKKYSYELEGNKVYLPVSVAYQIYKDLTSKTVSSKETEKATVSTKPSPRANEKSVSTQGEGRPPARNLQEAIWRAKAIVGRQLQS